MAEANASEGDLLGAGDDAPQAYLPSSSSLGRSGENVTGNTTTTADAEPSGGADASAPSGGDDMFSMDQDDSSLTCGCLPRVVEGQLLSMGGRSIDYYMNPVTMLLSIVVIWSFVIWCATDDEAGEQISEWQSWIITYWTWFYVFSMICMGGFTTFMMFSRFGDIKLGPKDEPPRFSVVSWFAMLFSAGVGVGLYFYGVAEPIWHYYDAKNGNNRYYTDGDNLERALDAMNVSWFHWGLTASSVYCVVGLPLAYFTHVKNAPLKFSSAFVPLLGNRYANGFIGDLIDTFAVVGTMFGVSTSLGLGVIQLNAFLNFMDPDTFDNDDTDLRLIIIWIITAFATISVFTGLDVGIRRLSEGNFAFCLILLFYLFFICDPFYLTNLFIQTCGYHVNHLLELTFFTDAFQQAGFTDGNDSYTSFMSWWTVFYWGWWIAWSPFVGIFIAQISRGRTIREFVIGNMLVPTLFTSLWLCIFGGVGLYSELAFDGMVGNANGVTVDCSDKSTYFKTYQGNNVAYLECFATEVMLFQMIDRFPLGGLMNVLAGIGIVTYFVTSSDSASHVIDVLTANGNEEPPKLQRIFWAFSEGAVASVLLSIGGADALSALQTVSIASGLPFCAILLLLCYAFYYALQVDMGEIDPSMRHNWSTDFWDTANPAVTYFGSAEKPARRELCCSWIRGLLMPPIENWNNFLSVANKDVEERVFGNSIAQRVLWCFLLLGPFVCMLLFCIMGAFLEGWVYVGLVFYIFYVFTNAYQRGRIRAFYGIDGSFGCDLCAHFLCCAAWAIAQEQTQIREGVELQVQAPQQESRGDVSPQAGKKMHVADKSDANLELTEQYHE